MENQKHYEIIEHYQALYQKNNRSKIFAPLAESYLKIGLLQPALEICLKGVKMHPHFPSGHIALAKVYLLNSETDKAIPELKKVIELAPENLLAHKLLAEVFLKQKKYKSALRSFKMLSFLTPRNNEVLEQIQKLEKLIFQANTDTFEMKSLQEIKPSPPLSVQSEEIPDFLERTLSLVDAYIQRNETQTALKTLKEAENNLGRHPQITKRIRFLSARATSRPLDMDIIEEQPVPATLDVLKKVKFLKNLLVCIEKNAKVIL